MMCITLNAPYNVFERAVIYARYSSHSQNERSIEGQLQDCYAYAERCGLTVVGEYIDRATTGTNDGRAEFQRMIADAAKKQFKYIIVYKLDRFARNRYDSAIYKNKLKKFDVRVVSAMEQISDSPEGIILESVLEGMAEYYSANLSQNVKRGMRIALQNKTFIGGVPPYGYKVVDKHVEIDERTAPIAKMIFKKYAEGVPKVDIIRELNEKGCKSSTGVAFSTNSLQNMFNNKKYMGIHMVDGEEADGIYPPIVDKATFEKVQERAAKNKRTPGAQKAKVDYLLQSKAFCGYCGAPMVGDSGTSRHGIRYYYYSCAGHKKNTKSCQKKREKKDFIEWYVVEQTVLYVLSPERIEYIAERIADIYKKEFNESGVAELEKHIASIEKEINGLVDLALNAKSRALLSQIDARAENLTKRKEELSVELTKLKIATRVHLTKADIVKWLKSFCNGDLFDMDFRKRIIDTFINSVYLFDDKVVIYYNIKDGKQVSHIEMLESIDGETEFLDPVDSHKGSDFKSSAPPHQLKSEHYFVFVNGLFGIVIPRT